MRESIYRALNKSLTDRAFLKEMGSDRRAAAARLQQAGLKSMATELALAALPDGRFPMLEAAQIAIERFDELTPAPAPRPRILPAGGTASGAANANGTAGASNANGAANQTGASGTAGAANAAAQAPAPDPALCWLAHCYDWLLAQLFPAMGEPEDTEEFHRGRTLLLQILRGLFDYERSSLPFDPTRDMTLLTDREIEEGGYSREYLKLHHLVRSKYIYEFMRIGVDITPFNTLGHISGVHYVAMWVARQLAQTEVPIDLGIVSGAAAGHDIGKYGCRPGEERRVPYLHYYYTDRCYERFGLPSIGHIAANHSTWDLELENLSIESLILIYSDFRVKSHREKGQEIIQFYTLKDSFDVILNKLDDVDEAKRRRYQKVYAKLKDFEDYMKEQGVQTDLPDTVTGSWHARTSSAEDDRPVPQQPEQQPQKIHREMVFLEGDQITEQLKFAAIDHNIRLMSRFHGEQEFSSLIEAARSEHNWRNQRTYLNILGEYNTYLTERQKQMTMKFLCELLAHREGDIRSRAAELMGNVTGTYREDYKKELPDDVELPDNVTTNVSLFAQYVEKIIHPDRKLTDQHRFWTSNCLNSYVRSTLYSCRPYCRHRYIDVLEKWYQDTSCDDETYIVLLKTLTDIELRFFTPSFRNTAMNFIDSAMTRGSMSRRVAAVRARSYMLYGFGSGAATDVPLTENAIRLDRLSLQRQQAEALQPEPGRSGKRRESPLDQGAEEITKSFVPVNEQTGSPAAAGDSPRNPAADATARELIRVMGIDESPERFSATQANMFLDDLKAGTPWIIKVANIDLMVWQIKSGLADDQANVLHVATHLTNLLKVSETVSVRKAAGRALLEIVDRMSYARRNELAVELFNGLELEDYQYASYIPDYLGVFLLHLPPKELDECISMLRSSIENASSKSASAAINTLGVMTEHYADYQGRFMESREVYEGRAMRILYLLNKAYAHYDPAISQESFRVMAQRIFGSHRITRSQVETLFTENAKKMLSLISERTESALEFYNNASVLNHVYRYISSHETEEGPFKFETRRRAAFYPGTFDPFSLGHRAVAKKIADMGMDVYLALDEFSWSKNTQPRLRRRKIMTMSVADEPHIYPFPEDISVNIANPEDLHQLQLALAGREVYIAVGSDVVDNASCYRKEPVPWSIHDMNHIIFARESKENRADRHVTDKAVGMSGLVGSDAPLPAAPEETPTGGYPITGHVLKLKLPKYYEDISSTRIRENIDLGRDISSLVDPIAQNYIYDRNLYLREPAYKHVLQARDITISSYERRSFSSLEPLAPELHKAGYNLNRLGKYLDQKKVRTLHIDSDEKDGKMLAYAAAHRLETNELLEEFGDLDIASHIREQANGGIAVIGFLYAGKSRRLSNLGQIVLTEVLTELISRDFAYAVYHPADPAGMNPRVIEILRRQGFVNIAPDHAAPVYAVDMKSPLIIFRDVETMIKNPLNKSHEVQKAIDTAHNNLLRVMNNLYPGQLVLSFNTSAVHNKIINLVAEINHVPTEPGDVRGPYMSVPFGKALSGVLVPNTVTKVLHTEKYFHRDLNGFTINQSRQFATLENQARAIRSFDRPVILIDDLLHKGYRMRIVDKLLREAGVDVKELVVGVMTGKARDTMLMEGHQVSSAYFLPTLKVWLNERDCYPFIGGDSLEGLPGAYAERNASINLIMPYTAPKFIAGGNFDGIYEYSMTCLQNSHRIWETLERVYQNHFERTLTLKRIGEVITYPRIPDIGAGVQFDPNLPPSKFIESDIEKLVRLKWEK